jgi:hypothetical protein
MIWTGKNAQKVLKQVGQYKWYLLHKLMARAESEKEFWWITFEHGKEEFDISEEYITQPIYEN